MLRAQEHRGPDGAGIAAIQHVASDSDALKNTAFFSYANKPQLLKIPENISPTCVLGHNLLAVQDRGESARQPMKDGNLTLVFNGEIYNFIELREELRLSGETFVTKSDTEVLLKLWKRHGQACINKLRGMFAFVIHDSSNNTLYACRDPYGIKPLYTAVYHGNLYLASEIRALHAAGIPRKLKESAVIACVAAAVNEFGEKETLYEDIFLFPPGSWIQWKNNGETLQRYYRLPSPIGDLHDESAISGLREKLTESVKLHLRSTRRLATCLSGGLDSTNLAWLIGEILGEESGDFAAFTICSANKHSSEIEQAKLVTEKAGLAHHVYDCDASIDPADVLEMALACETPNHTVGPINQFMLLRQIARSGATVVLDGQGGDELVSGYPWYWPVLINAIEKQGGDITHLQKLRPERLPLRPEIADMFDRRFHNSEEWINAVMGKNFLGVSSGEVASLKEVQYYLWGGGEWESFRERAYYRGELRYLLRQEDRLGMWFGLECRVPYVDRPLIDYVSRFSPELLLKDGYLKYPLRAVIPEVPDSIRWNVRKQGFWDTDPARYSWMNELAGELAPACKILRSVFPRLEDELHSLNFNQIWRLIQVSLLEQCSSRQELQSFINTCRLCKV